jgi:hypothetical protein
MVAASSSERSRAEAERQLSAAAERHCEVLASMLQLGRPEAVKAVKAVGRGVQLVSFALKRAAEVGIPFERLVELTEWEPDLVREGLERAVPEPWVRGRDWRRPASTPARSPQAAAAFDALARLQDFTQRVLADLDREAGASSSPASVDLNELHDRWETAWRPWRERLGGRET